MATAYKKISELLPVDAATLTNDEPIPTVQNGATKAVTGNQILTEAGFRGAGSYVVGMESLIRSLIQGLKLTRISTTTFSVDIGVVGDSTFAQGLKLEATTTKSTSAWAVGSGSGGLDTGTIANSTWYAVFLIKRTDTEVVDVIISLSATLPTLPSNYTLFRRVGWIYINASTQIASFTQQGRTFKWDSKNIDLNAATPASTNRILTTVVAPVNVEGIFIIELANSTNAVFLDSGETERADAAASATNCTTRIGAGGASTANVQRIFVDASRQIYYRVSTTSSTLVSVLGIGWIDEL